MRFTQSKTAASISLLDRYIIKQLILPFCFGLVVFTVVSELIGISFEQVKFIVKDSLPVFASLQVHYLKLPQFISISLPFACLFAALITYNQLAKKYEIIAFQSLGTSLYRIVRPALILSILLTIIMFIFNETIVPPANYKAALVLEDIWQVDRNILAKYNKQALIYPEFESQNKQQQLQSVFIADRIKGRQTRGVTILQFKDARLQQVVTSQLAIWNDSKNVWNLFNGSQNIIDKDGNYLQKKTFQKLSLNLPKNILDYANNNYDNREMNIRQLYQRLKIIEPVAKDKKIRQLKINIQERYAFPFSCVVFTLLGSALGITSKPTDKANGLGIIAIVIFAYYTIQFLTTVLAVTGAISVIWGVWLPNLLGIGTSFCFLSPLPRVKITRELVPLIFEL